MASGNIKTITSALTSSGIYTPTIRSGGSAVTWSSNGSHWFRFGNIVHVVLMFWALSITNPTDSVFQLSIPIPAPVGTRSYGSLGFCGVPVLRERPYHIVLSGQEFAFEADASAGTVITGNQWTPGIIQGDIWYTCA